MVRYFYIEFPLILSLTSRRRSEVSCAKIVHFLMLDLLPMSQRRSLDGLKKVREYMVVHSVASPKRRSSNFIYVQISRAQDPLASRVADLQWKGWGRKYTEMPSAGVMMFPESPSKWDSNFPKFLAWERQNHNGQPTGEINEEG
jgi:hypothetical protein